MATVKKGILTTACQWAKHQRPYWSRQFWKRERQAERQSISRRAAFDEFLSDQEIHDECEAMVDCTWGL
jgi:hypothetical protein